METPDPDTSSKHVGLVLVIEENVAVSDMLCWALGTTNHRTTTLSSWQDIGRWIENALHANDLPILILLDLSNPLHIDAVATLQQLRTQWRATASTPPPMIVLTTLEQVYTSLSAAGENVLRKPFHMKELFLAIQRVLAQA